MTEPVNLARLEAFSDGSPSGLADLVRLFLEDSRETLALLIDAGRRQDEDGIRLLAHRFGGTCAACGAELLAGKLLALETRPAAEGPDDACRRIEAIRGAHHDAVVYLTGFLRGLSQS